MPRSMCENCGIMIRWQPTIIGDKTYCCLGCAQGGPCECDYDNLPHPDERNALVVRPARELARHEAD